MTDREAFLRKIAASPEDDVARLVYADWCEELGTDRELATAEFIRLTCGLPEPKRGKTRRCPECSGHGYYFDLESSFGEEDAITCPKCRTTGRVPNTGPWHRQYPKAAHEWLLANWRRLVPGLTRDWEHELVVNYLGWFQKQLETNKEFNPAPEQIIGRWDEWRKRGSLRAAVPMVLPSHDNAEKMKCYSPVVELSFHRGFVTDASWRAPRLGEKIAAILAEDQPLAEQTGPHALGKFGEVTMGTILSATFVELGNMRYEQVRRDLEASANLRSLLRGRPNPTPEEAP